MSSNDHFHFPRKQRAGVILLVTIIVAGPLAWRIINAVKPSTVQAIAPNPVRVNGQKMHTSTEKDIGNDVDRTPAPFDPNTAGEEQLVASGLPLRTARTLIKYRSKGGKFYQKEDLLKLYTISREDYNRIEKYINIKADPLPRTAFRHRSGIKTADVIDLNHTDLATLIALKGIGPGYAKRILGYQEKLGGFSSIEQLKEVYGFPDSTYRELKSRFKVNPSDVRKININKAGERELAAHPYIRTGLAAGIIKLRNDLKKFSKTEELRQVPLINEEKYRKIAPYLSVN